MADRRSFPARYGWLVLFCAFLAVGFSLLADLLPQLSARPRWSHLEVILALSLPALLSGAALLALWVGARFMPAESRPIDTRLTEILTDREFLMGVVVFSIAFHAGWFALGWLGWFSASAAGLVLGVLFVALMIALLAFIAGSAARDSRRRKAHLVEKRATRHDQSARRRDLQQATREEETRNREKEKWEDLARQREQLEHARLLLLREHMDLFPHLDKDAWAQPRVMELTQVPEDLDDPAAVMLPRYESLSVAMRLEAARHRILRDYDRAGLGELGLTDRAQLEKLLDEIVAAVRSRRTIAPADAFAHLQAIENRLALVLASAEAKAITEEQRARAYEAIFDDDLLRAEARRPIVTTRTNVSFTGLVSGEIQESADVPSRHDA